MIVAVEFVVETSWIVLVILIFGLDQGIGAIDGLDGMERDIKDCVQLVLPTERTNGSSDSNLILLSWIHGKSGIVSLRIVRGKDVIALV
ncbi:hypothetical protein Tco_1556482 [Tanacetum coccineum]